MKPLKGYLSQFPPRSDQAEYGRNRKFGSISLALFTIGTILQLVAAFAVQAHRYLVFSEVDSYGKTSSPSRRGICGSFGAEVFCKSLPVFLCEPH